MALENLTATSRGEKAIGEIVPCRYGLNVFESTVEVSAAANDGSTYKMAKIPTNIRISGQSLLISDDLASSGSPVMEVGLSGDQITDDPDCISTGIALSSAQTGAPLFTNPADVGKYAWELAGLSSDPGGWLWVVFEIETAAANDGGTVTLSLVYIYDGS